MAVAVAVAQLPAKKKKKERGRRGNRTHARKKSARAPCAPLSSSERPAKASKALPPPRLKLAERFKLWVQNALHGDLIIIDSSDAAISIAAGLLDVESCTLSNIAAALLTVAAALLNIIVAAILNIAAALLIIIIAAILNIAAALLIAANA